MADVLVFTDSERRASVDWTIANKLYTADLLFNVECESHFRRRMTYRVRVTGGEFKGQWLRSIAVTQNGAPFNVTDWPSVAAQAKHYKFFPSFAPNEESAFRAISLEASENFRKILRHCKIESEVVEVDASAASTTKS